MTFHTKTSQAAKGKWKGILLQLGVPETSLTGKHCACPMCGGRDRFRFDNKEGAGTYFCNACGAGDGMKLAVEFTGQPFREVAARVDAMLGNVTSDSLVRQAIPEEERRSMLNEVWRGARPVCKGDLVDTYLASRRLDEVVYPKALRFAPAIRDGDGGIRPAMLAMVTDQNGKPVTIHRTFLRPDGKAKADMTSPRKLMPGEIPEGSAVRLTETVGCRLGIAEGIETAMAASARFDMPVWAAVSAGNLAKWIQPEGVEEIVIFGDNDPKFAGQAAAYALARRLCSKGVSTEVHIPNEVGLDWADV